jgi:hypothetical protein
LSVRAWFACEESKPERGVFSFRVRIVQTVIVALTTGLAALIGYASMYQPYHAYPLPHCIPKYPGGVSLRFAMVHDVLHERYTRHGDAYYAERNRRVREAMQKIEAEQGPNPTSNQYLALFDDLGAGLDALKDDNEAVRVLRDKLRRQEDLGLKGRDLYTTYANLGTFLIHGSFPKAVAGDATAKDCVSEGICFISQSIAVNPQAHFGREIWQQRTAEFLLESIDRPRQLLERDLVGNRLDAEVDPSDGGSISSYGEFHEVEQYSRYGYDRETSLIIEGRPTDASSFSRETLRNWITRVGDPAAIPFDEPTLGIVGMWRLGGGANPHFALALGEIMMRVGQRHIAWCAYERAAQLAGRVWPDPEIQKKFSEHCRKRQVVIEKQLPDEERDQLRPRFDAELAFGKRYQESYQAYEAERIQEGASIDNEHFYDEFFAKHEQIASPVGQEDLMVVVHGNSLTITIGWPQVVLFTGIVAFATACVLRLAAMIRNLHST